MESTRYQAYRGRKRNTLMCISYGGDAPDSLLLKTAQRLSLTWLYFSSGALLLFGRMMEGNVICWNYFVVKEGEGLIQVSRNTAPAR